MPGQQPFPQSIFMPQSQHPLSNAISPSDTSSEAGSSIEADSMQDVGPQPPGSTLAMPTPEPYRIDESGLQDGRLGLRDVDDDGGKGDETLDEAIPGETTSGSEPRKVWTGRRTLRRLVTSVCSENMHAY